jgi:hypothetical protein
MLGIEAVDYGCRKNGFTYISLRTQRAIRTCQSPDLSLEYQICLREAAQWLVFWLYKDVSLGHISNLELALKLINQSLNLFFHDSCLPGKIALCRSEVREMIAKAGQIAENQSNHSQLLLPNWTLF